jgi:hypothetical protein
MTVKDDDWTIIWKCWYSWVFPIAICLVAVASLQGLHRGVCSMAIFAIGGNVLGRRRDSAVIECTASNEGQLRGIQMSTASSGFWP